MFNFKKKILSPLVADVSNQIDSVLKLQSVADKVEQLLLVKKASDEKFERIKNDAADAAGTVLFSGFALAMAGMSFGVLLALPALSAVAFGFFALCVAPFTIGLVVNADRVSNARQGSDQKIGDEVINLVRAAPQEAAKSPRLIKALAQIFNGDASASFHTRPLSLARLGTERKPAVLADCFER